MEQHKQTEPTNALGLERNIQFSAPQVTTGDISATTNPIR